MEDERSKASGGRIFSSLLYFATFFTRGHLENKESSCTGRKIKRWLTFFGGNLTRGHCHVKACFAWSNRAGWRTAAIITHKMLRKWQQLVTAKQLSLDAPAAAGVDAVQGPDTREVQQIISRTKTGHIDQGKQEQEDEESHEDDNKKESLSNYEQKISPAQLCTRAKQSEKVGPKQHMSKCWRRK